MVYKAYHQLEFNYNGIIKVGCCLQTVHIMIRLPILQLSQVVVLCQIAKINDIHVPKIGTYHGKHSSAFDFYWIKISPMYSLMFQVCIDS